MKPNIGLIGFTVMLCAIIALGVSKLLTLSTTVCF